MAADCRAGSRDGPGPAPRAGRGRVVLRRDTAPSRLRHGRLGEARNLGGAVAWDPLDLPHDEMPDEPIVPRDRSARPSLDEVLALRADRRATVRQVIAGLTDEKLAGMTEPVLEPGYPEPESFAVRRCLQAILNEEWEHRLYAERDFEVLESRSS